MLVMPKVRTKTQRRYFHQKCKQFMHVLHETIDTKRQRHFWSRARQHHFLMLFHDLQETGYAPASCLQIIQSKYKSTTILPIIQRYEAGFLLSETLEHLKFDARAIYFIKTHENQNMLLLGIKKAHQFLNQQIMLQKQFKKQLQYPIKLFILTVVALIGMLLFFVPQLEQFYDSLNLVQSVDYFSIVINMVVCICVLSLLCSLCYVVTRYCQYSPLVNLLHRFYFSPLLRTVSQTIFSYYFASSWVHFLSCGCSFKETLHSMATYEKIPYVRRQIQYFLSEIEVGSPLVDVVSHSQLFTPHFKLVFSHGLSLGSIEKVLTHYHTEQFELLKNRLSQTLKTIQFLFLSCIGIMIVFIYLSILQPVFDMLNYIN